MSSNGYTLAHPADLNGETSYTFTCGKIDAGIAVLIGSHAHLIEFPSLLLPPGCEPGSIVSITCARDQVAEKQQAESFWDLQNKIFEQFGVKTPLPPVLRVRSVTQTSVTLEWDRIELAKSKLLSLSIWKNGQRLGTISNPTQNTSTKLSGLDLDTEYNFYLVMKTTGGAFNSKTVKVRTHSLNDTSGISVCFGVILPQEVLERSKQALEKLNGRWTEKIQIDTTHFVCTMPYHPQQNQNKNAPANSFLSLEYQRALQLSIPIVQPTWLFACLSERKMVPIAAHYLGAQPPNLNLMLNGSSSPAGNQLNTEHGRRASGSALPSPIAMSPPDLGPRHTRAGSASASTTLPPQLNQSVYSENNLSPTSTLPPILESPVDKYEPVIPPIPNQTIPTKNELRAKKDESSSKSSTSVIADSAPSCSISGPPQPILELANPSAGLSDLLKEVEDSPSFEQDEQLTRSTQVSTASRTALEPEVESKTKPGHFLSAAPGVEATRIGPGEVEDDPFSAMSPGVSPMVEQNFSRLSLNLITSASPVTPTVTSDSTGVTPLGKSSESESMSSDNSEMEESREDRREMEFEDVMMNDDEIGTPKNLTGDLGQSFLLPGSVRSESEEHNEE